MTEKTRFSVSLEDIPANEQIIFKLIFSVSERTNGKTNQYQLSQSDSSQNTDLVICDGKLYSEEKDNRQNKKVIWLFNPGQSLQSISSIERPLIATRVLTSLDKIISTMPSSSAQTVSAAEIPSPATGESTSTNTDVNFNITEEEASELAIVHDETLANPANLSEDATDVDVSVNTINFSAADNNLIKAEAIESITDKYSSDTVQVLVVDDSPSVRKQLEIELSLFDVVVDFAADAQQAIEYLDKKHYAVAFLDVVLPDQDGFSICKHIKSNTKNTRVVMLTGKAKPSDKVKGSLAGCDAYLVKPVGRQTFQNTASKYLALKNAQEAIQA